MGKLLSIILIIALLLTLTACNSAEPTSGIVADKFTGEACLFRLGQLTMAKPIQTGYVIVVQSENGTQEIAVSEEQYKAVNVGDWIEI